MQLIKSEKLISIFIGGGIILIGLGNISPASALVIGGWDATRASSGFNLPTGTELAALRSLISSNFSGTTFVGTSELTPSFLSSIDILLINTAIGNNTAITPLSSSEQTALVSFIQGGGSAFLDTDNDSFDAQANAANNSFVNPFGVTATGTLNGLQNITVTNPSSSPVTNGSFGTVNTLLTNFPGWYSTLGANAVGLGTLDSNGQTALATISRNQLAAGSGAVVLLSDIGPLVDVLITSADNSAFVLNSIAFLSPITPPPSTVPEPSSILGLGTIAALGLGATLKGKLKQKKSS